MAKTLNGHRGAGCQVVALGLALALSGCSVGPGDKTRSPTDAAFAGALVVQTVAGSKAAYAPGHSPYYYTQGFVICRDGRALGRDPVLRSISYNAKLKPLVVRPVIRRIPAAADRKGAPYGWTPILDALGRPGDFEHSIVRGDFSTRFNGTKVTVSCDQASDPEAELMELEIVMKVPRAGADIDGFTITYEVDGAAHRLHVPWRMVGCGTKTDRRLCTPPAAPRRSTPHRGIR